jgi:hypothetical protein
VLNFIGILERWTVGKYSLWRATLCRGRTRRSASLQIVFHFLSRHSRIRAFPHSRINFQFFEFLRLYLQAINGILNAFLFPIKRKDSN